jgi:DNA-binding SARP family transcriptional activator
VRLKLVLELASEHTSGIAEAVVDAAQVSELALLETADALGPRLHLLRGVMSIVDASVGRWPGRWLPVLRKQLELGNDPRAHIAAELLDRHGTLDDISRLRAFDRTYRRKAVTSALGRELVRRVSPRVTIHDLGQVAFSVGDRLVKLSRMRRRSGALLMYLVTRPNFTATREQVIEDLWPDGDLGSGTNSLNQSLYFLRRDIDPWYEADVSAEYVTLEAELVSLDPELVRSESTEFVAKTRQTMAAGSGPELLGLVESYRGQFAPEFEYEEWALSWRARVHAAYLNFARTSVDHLARVGDLRTACDIALRASAIDPGASDIERALIWLYWRMGATSAAETQYLHWASSQRADGMDPVSLSALVGSVSPP